MPLPPILVIKTGTTDPAVVASDGDYDDWFLAALEDGGRRCVVLEAWGEGTLPFPGSFGGVLLTGSPRSVRDEDAWMASLAGWTLSAARSGVPVLAVCFGHQLIGEALGGWIAPNSNGGEYGTIDVSLTEAGRSDPLFAGLPETVTVQSTHKDVLERAPTDEGVTRLAGNENTTWQAFAWGEHLRAVQFHPEMSAHALRKLIAVRGLEGDVWGTDHGARILHNWDRTWVRRRAQARRAPPPAR